MKITELKDRYQEKKIEKSQFIKDMHKFHAVLAEFAENLNSTDIQKIEILQNEVRFILKHRALSENTPAVIFIIDKEDQRVAPVESFNFNTYEYSDFRMIVELFGDNQTFLDIGANVGFHSLSLSKEFQGSRFYAFEPVPKTFSLLQRHVDLNNSNNILIKNNGISNENGVLTFYCYSEGYVNASSRNLSEREDVFLVSAPVVTLDDFTLSEEFRHGKVDFIKCDVEGAEYFVFLGAKQTIERDRPIVFSEILRKWSKKFDYDPNEIFNFFESLGYGAYTAKENGKLRYFKRMNDETLETNFFFIPKEKDITKWLE